MTTISAKIIADSVSDDGVRLTTMELRYPRCIHSEFMTHRQFSRNAASSRAIPVSKMIQSIKDDPFVPLVWGKNQKGMQATEECNEPVIPIQLEEVPHTNQEAWLAAMQAAMYWAEAFNRAGYHKQIVNRLLEPWMHITVVCSSTSWSNFLALREHKDAEPHIRLLACKMRDALGNNDPDLLHQGEWHLPYVDRAATMGEEYPDLVKLSAARCARTSYLLHNGERPTQADDMALYERLASSAPLHASPLEHQATPDYKVGVVDKEWQHSEEHGNFSGWRQFRKMIRGECQ